MFAASATIPTTQQVIPRTLRWRMKLSSAITAFIAELRVNKSPLTVISYESHLRRLCANVQVDTVLRFTTELVKSEMEQGSAKGWKMSTLHSKRAAFNTFGKWGVRNKLWPTNPVEHVQSIKRPKHLPRPFSTDEAERLMGLRLPPQQRLILMLFFLTGLRVTPIGSLKVGDITFAPPKIRAWVKGAKTQVIEMHPDLAEPLRAYILKHTNRKAHTFLFPSRAGGPMHRRRIEDMTIEWGKAAGVVNCTPHRFRHSFGSRLYEQTRDLGVVKEAMGHEDISSTLIYTKISSQQIATAISGLNFGPKQARVIARPNNQDSASSSEAPVAPPATT